MKQWLRNTSVLRGLNSLTKFPSIPTLHAMGQRGKLGTALTVEGTTVSSSWASSWVTTEKVDGTNARALLFPDGSFLFGSREELLWYSEDVVHNPAGHVVETLQGTFEVMGTESEIVSEIVLRDLSGLVALYFEVYGHAVGKAASQYAGASGLRDAVIIDAAFWPGHSWLRKVCDESLDEIARDREAGGTPFLPWASVLSLAGSRSLGVAPELAAPPLGDRSHESLLRHLGSMAPSRVLIDPDAPGKPEGVVLRATHGNVDGTSPVVRVKLRREDYERAARVETRRIPRATTHDDG